MFQGFKPPTQKIVLRNSGYSVEIWPELAGGVARFDKELGNGKIIDLFRPAKDFPGYSASDLGCFPLLPYSNRIAGREFSFQGKSYKLDPNVEWDKDITLHGLGWQRAWCEVTRDTRSATVALDHQPDGDWPFAFSAKQSYALDGNGLTITTSITNTDTREAPYGIGQHPRFPRPGGTILRAHVDGVWKNDPKTMPENLITLPNDWDFHKGRVLDIAMDNVFTNFKGPAEISWPANCKLIMSGSEALRFLVTYNPLHEDFFCAEPVTHMTDAINRHAKGRPVEETGFSSFRPGQTVNVEHKFTCLP